MTKLLGDLKYTLRTIASGRRSVTAMAVLAFALGIGVTTAVFSIFNSVLLAPLPYPDPDQLVAVYDTQPACATCPASFPKFHDWKERNQVFDAIGGSTQASFVLTGWGDADRVAAMATTATLADVLRVPPAIGRWYTAEEDQPGGPRVVVVSHGFWTRRLGADPQVVGSRLLLDGEPYEVLGVMPQGFSHRGADAFVPLQRKLDPSTRGSHFLVTYARLKKGVTLERATTEMRALGQTLAREFNHNHGIDVRALHEVVVGQIRTPLKVLLGAVFLVLLVACANVANLLLASGLARRRELAIRLALGARRGDLARQLVAEAMILALAGGALGVLLAFWAVRTFVALAGSVLPRAATIGIDGRVVLFTAVLSLLVGVVCGIWPLLRMRVTDLAAAVREGDTRTGSGQGRRFGNGLVIGEIALAFALLVGAGLLVKNLMLLQRRDAGVETARIVTFDVNPSGARYASPEQVKAFYRDLLERLKPIGGIEAVGVVSHLPMYRFGTNGEMTREGGNPWPAGDNPLVEYRWVGGDYFRALGIRLLEGRLFDDRDRSTQSIVVSRRLAEKFWPGENALGRRLAPGSSASWWEVIGVVSDVRSFGLTATSPFEMYRWMEHQPFASSTVVMRTAGENPDAAVGAARQIVASIDPNLPLTTVQTMEQVVSSSVRQPRLLSALSGLFAVLAGLLAMVGIYGVTAYNVRRERREFGIRLALGADPRRVQLLVVRRGLMASAAGIVLGIAGALLLTRTLQTMLDDVEPTDPAVFAGNAAMVLLVSLVACYLPARSAGRVDPIVVLRDS